MTLVQLAYNLKSDFRGHSIARHKSGAKRGAMEVITQDQTVVWRILCFPVPSRNPHIFEVHALEYKMRTKGRHLKSICHIFCSLYVSAATEVHLKDGRTALKAM